MKTIKQLRDEKKAKKTLEDIENGNEMCIGVLGSLIEKAEEIIADDDEDGELWSDTHSRRSDSDSVSFEKIMNEHLAIKGACSILKKKLKEAGHNKYRIVITGGEKFSYEEPVESDGVIWGHSRHTGISHLVVTLKKE